MGKLSLAICPGCHQKIGRHDGDRFEEIIKKGGRRRATWEQIVQFTWHRVCAEIHGKNKDN